MVLFFVSLTLSHAPACAVRPQIYGSGLRDVPVYSLAFASTYCACPWRDGQAELTWVIYHDCLSVRR